MTKRTNGMLALAAVAVVALFVTTQVASQDKPAQPPEGGEMAEMMAKWAALNAKGPEHERFKEMVGKFDTESKMWMAPGAPPIVSKGTAEFRLILDGRYVEQIFKCDDMMGAPYEGRGLEGYDCVRKKYVSLWLDNTSTGMFVSEGTADAAGDDGSIVDQRLTPANLTYQGAFRLPDEFNWGARGLSYYPSGSAGVGSLLVTGFELIYDPAPPGESCWDAGWNCQAHYGEVTIPTPADPPGEDYSLPLLPSPRPRDATLSCIPSSA